MNDICNMNKMEHHTIPYIKRAYYKDGAVVIHFKNGEVRYLLPEFLPSDEHILKICENHIWPHIAYNSYSIIWIEYNLLNSAFEIGHDSAYMYSQPYAG